MSRSRLVLFASMSVVVLGVLAGLGALWMDPARAAVGPLPGEALVLPADTRFVMGIDVRRVVASPFWARYGSERSMRPQAWRQLEEMTGLDPARDVDQIVVAGSGTATSRTPPLVLAVGRFDPDRIAQTLQTSGKATLRDVGGVRVYEFAGPSPSASRTQTLAMALLDRRTVVLGPPDGVEATVRHRAAGESPLQQNKGLLGLIERVRPGSSFWMVGDQTLLASLPNTFSGPGTGGSGDMGPSMNLPTLKAVTVTADLDPEVSLAIVGEAIDDPSATKLADVVRGFVALATLQARQKPELQRLGSAISVATEANRVLLNARLPYELIDSLRAMAMTSSAGATDEGSPAEEAAKPK